MKFNQIRNWYCYQELKDLGFAAMLLAVLWLLMNFGETVLRRLSTGSGKLYTLLLMAGLVIAISVEMYFRVKHMTEPEANNPSENNTKTK